VRLNPDLPTDLERIINRALEKDRNLRYQHASEMRVELQRLKRDTTSGVLSGSHAMPSVSPAAQPPAIASTVSSDSGTAASAVAQMEPAHPSGSAVVEAAKHHKLGLTAGVAIALIVLAAASYGVYFMFSGKAAIPFQNFAVTQVTNSGKAVLAAVSPDGKYVVSVVDDNGKQSLWLRNVPTGSNTQVLEPDPFTIRSPAFSPDGNYIFYRKAADATESVFRVYRMPVLGGTPQVLVNDVDAGPTFSPDGKRMAYMRANDPEAGKYRLLSSNLDGSDEKILQIAPLPFPDSLSWSPDGKRIAFISYSQSNAQGQISTFDMASSKDTPLTSFPNKVFSDLAWTPDGLGLLVNFADRTSGSTNRQIGFVSYPAGRFQSLTNDTRGYRTLSLSADGKSIVSIQRQESDSVSVQPAASNGASATVPGLPNQAEVRGGTGTPTAICSSPRRLQSCECRPTAAGKPLS
jgi:Tol biopolymer transport system component